MPHIISNSLQDDFIQKVVEDIETVYIPKYNDLSRLAVIFPGKRPSLFLKRLLAQRIKKGFVSPKFYSIDEFISYIVAKKHVLMTLPDLEASFLIYSLAREQMPEFFKRRYVFSDFLPWAQEIRAFIDLLDLEHISSEKLNAVEVNAAIGYDVPETLNAMLRKIAKIREQYHRQLEEKKSVSRGLRYLYAMRIVESATFEEFDSLLFCNFFQCYRTEENIIKTICGRGKARLLFQGDQREWNALEKTANVFDCSIKTDDQRDLSMKDLTIYACQDMHSQVALVRTILEKITDPEKTVVVLPDPGALVPLLSEIASLKYDFNVSMGYPLNRSALFSLMKSIFKAQRTRKANAYYSKDYLAVISHPLIKNIVIDTSATLTRIIVHKIEEFLLGVEESVISGNIFVKLSEIEETGDLFMHVQEAMHTMGITVELEDVKRTVQYLHQMAFIMWEQSKTFIYFAKVLDTFVNALMKTSLLANYPLNLSILKRIVRLKEELEVSSYKNESFEPDEIFRIFEKKLAQEKISFKGSPLKGLQILGMLETRALTFDTVIIMDVNEGKLPSIQRYTPLIPREIMSALGLQSMEQEEELELYYFKRIVMSAKKVHVLYEESIEHERSRFLEEIIWEEEKREKVLATRDVVRKPFKIQLIDDERIIKKSEQVLSLLDTFVYSASSINTYMHCPLRFYYQYVLRLKEKEDILEAPEAAEIGDFLHRLLEDMYQEFIDKPLIITEEYKKKFLSILNRRFNDEFESKMRSDAFIMRDILEYRMIKYLEFESNRNIERILGLEKEYKTNIVFKNKSFSFTAKVDRIDQLKDGTILILDYKSGAENPLPRSVEHIKNIDFAADDVREQLSKKIISFQLPLYCYLAQKDFSDRKINAALYFLRSLKITALLKELTEYHETIQVVMKCLEWLMDDIVNPDVPFAAFRNEQKCSYCPFFYMCT